MKEFLQTRLELVDRMQNEIDIAGYSDLALILTAVLSACASRRWPGEGKDKKRFVELLVRTSEETFHTDWVSIPALLNDGAISEEETPYGLPGATTRIFRDDEIDLQVDDARNRYPNVEIRKLRKHSYACLIYEWLRCSLVHGYGEHENITVVPASRKAARVSYIGRSDRQKGPHGVRRMVSFHLDYLKNLAQHHVSQLAESPSPEPDTWWINED